MKIAFFDIDGTLIDVPNGMSQPSLSTIEALKEFQNQGNKVIIASARVKIPESVKVINPDGFIGVDGHYIEYNGKVLINDEFNDQEIDMQQSIYQNNNGEYIMYNPLETFYSSYDHPLIIKHENMFSGGLVIDDKCYKDYINKDLKVISVTAIFNDSKDLYNALEQLPKSWAINYYDTGHIRMDVHKPGFSKGSACEYLFKYLNIDKDDTYAFGDGLNDKEMLSLVGHGIAMKNGVKELFEYSDDITDTVNNDGIAKAFKKYFNI